VARHSRLGAVSGLSGSRYEALLAEAPELVTAPLDELGRSDRATLAKLFSSPLAPAERGVSLLTVLDALQRCLLRLCNLRLKVGRLHPVWRTLFAP
jgi:hypothetical protein